jgi:hypothetical protein
VKVYVVERGCYEQRYVADASGGWNNGLDWDEAVEITEYDLRGVDPSDSGS